MKKIWMGIGALVLASSGSAAPLTPTITGHDFNFGAFNGLGAPPEWATNGLAPDTLTFIPGGNEVTAYWPAWPSPPPNAVFDAAGAFGGDFILNVMFTGQDAPYVGPGGTLDVSLTGTGASVAGPDLMIFGGIPSLGIAPPLLWALGLDQVSLYGYSNWDAYVLEGVGTIVGGEIAQRNNLIGQTGVMRGNLDFLDRPVGWIPTLYDPLVDPSTFQIRAAYSGETGVGHAVPEPASRAALMIGGFGLLARRRRR